MKAIEFQSELTSEGVLKVPARAVDLIPPGQRVRVLVLLSESLDDQAWEQLAASEFGQGYAESDGIYDQLSGR